MKKELRCPKCSRTDGLRTFFHAQGEIYIKSSIDSQGNIPLPESLERGNPSSSTIACYSDPKETFYISFFYEEGEDPEPDIYCPICKTIFSAPEEVTIRCRTIE